MDTDWWLEEIGFVLLVILLIVAMFWFRYSELAI